jgi:hypothetical protein
LNKITDLKTAPKGVKQRKNLLQGGFLKEFFAGGKTKFIYFTGGKDLFTLLKNSYQNICSFFKRKIHVV